MPISQEAQGPGPGAVSIPERHSIITDSHIKWPSVVTAVGNITEDLQHPRPGGRKESHKDELEGGKARGCKTAPPGGDSGTEKAGKGAGPFRTGLAESTLKTLRIKLSDPSTLPPNTKST